MLTEASKQKRSTSVFFWQWAVLPRPGLKWHFWAVIGTMNLDLSLTIPHVHSRWGCAKCVRAQSPSLSLSHCNQFGVGTDGSAVGSHPNTSHSSIAAVCAASARPASSSAIGSLACDGPVGDGAHFTRGVRGRR